MIEVAAWTRKLLGGVRKAWRRLLGHASIVPWSMTASDAARRRFLFPSWIPLDEEGRLPTLVAGKGAYVWDTRGRKLLDVRRVASATASAALPATPATAEAASSCALESVEVSLENVDLLSRIGDPLQTGDGILVIRTYSRLTAFAPAARLIYV